jgi:hypothetical protein
MRSHWILIVAGMGVIGCGAHDHPTQPVEPFPAQQRAAVEGNVRQFMDSVANDVTQEGPAAWSREFSGEPTFFMVSDGVLVFPNGASAAQAIPSLAKAIQRIELHWGEDLRVDALTPELAVVGTSWQEVRDMQGHEVRDQGYCTGVVEQRNGKWEFRDMHWSTKKAEGGK